MEKYVPFLEVIETISDEKLNDEALDNKLNDLKNKRDSVIDENSAVRDMAWKIYDLMANGGESELVGGKVKFKDITSEQVKQFLPEVITVIMKDAVEPKTPISTMLFDQLQIDVDRTYYELGAESMVAHVEQVAEGSSFPGGVEIAFAGGEKVRAHMNKYGIKQGITEEAMKYDDQGWNFMGRFLNAAIRSFARKREVEAMQILLHSGRVGYDNVTPGNSLYGTTEGRALDGTQNGTMSMEDFDMAVAWMNQRGFNPDYLIMNPFSWMIFQSIQPVQEALRSNGGLQSVEIPKSIVSPEFGTRHGKLGTRYTSKGSDIHNMIAGKIGVNPRVSTLNPYGRVYELPPGLFQTNMRVITTPFVPVSTGTVGGLATDFTDVIMVDSGHCGAFLNQTNLTELMWDEVEKQVHWYAFYERYGALPYSKGEGTMIFKNIVLDKQYLFQNVNYQTLSNVTRDVQLVTP